MGFYRRNGYCMLKEAIQNIDPIRGATFSDIVKYAKTRVSMLSYHKRLTFQKVHQIIKALLILLNTDIGNFDVISSPSSPALPCYKYKLY